MLSILPIDKVGYKSTPIYVAGKSEKTLHWSSHSTGIMKPPLSNDSQRQLLVQFYGKAIWKTKLLFQEISCRHFVLQYVKLHYNDVIMGKIASQITSLTIVYSTVYSDADQRKHQSSTSLAFVRGIHRPVIHKWPVTRKMFPFDDVIAFVVLCVIVDISLVIVYSYDTPICILHGCFIDIWSIARTCTIHHVVNSFSPGQNGRHFADDVFRCILVNEEFGILIKISLKFVPKCPIDNNTTLV